MVTTISKKQTIIIIAITIAVLVIALFIGVLWSEGLFESYDGWKTVNIENCGSIKIPNEWKSYEKNNFIYVINEADKPVMIQSYSEVKTKFPNENEAGIVETNDFYTIQNIECYSHGVIGNGAEQGTLTQICDKTECERMYIALHGDKHVQFVVYDETLDFFDVKKIVNSYSRKYYSE